MSIAFGPLIAGAYTATYNAVDVGFTLDGFKYGTEWKQEIIEQSDLHGETIIDFIFRGLNAQILFTSRTFKIGAFTPFYPWGTALGTIFTDAAPIGRRASDVALAFVMSVKANTPAAATISGVTTINTLTATKSILAPNFRGELLFDSKVRQIPIQLQLLPYEGTSGTAQHCTLT